DHQGDVDEIEIADREGQEPLDPRVAMEEDEGDSADHEQRAHQSRRSGQVVEDLARRRPHHGQDEDDQQQIGDLEQEPAATEQQLQERTVVVRTRPPGQLEADGKDGAPHEHADGHAEEAAEWAGREEELHELAPRRVTAADHRRLEDEARQQVSLEEVPHRSIVSWCYPPPSTRRASSSARRGRSEARTHSWRACAPSPTGPRPSRVGTPAAAVRFPSEAPPTRAAERTKPRSAAIASARA